MNVQVAQGLPMIRPFLAGAVMAFSLAVGAQAAVVDSSPGGFEVSQSVEIAAPAAKVWAALGQPGKWWNPEHSWSGKPEALSLSLTPGGCFCEILANGGGAEHMRVIFVAPGHEARLEGALGPFQFSGASGHLRWVLTEKDGKTTFTQTFDAGGYFKGGIDKMPGPVDGVLSEQLGRLKQYVETGAPT